jgi:integrase
MLREAPPRKGFFEREQFEAVRRQLPPALQPIATVEYLTGWRNCSEVYRLTWAHVSFGDAMVRLDPGMAKNDEPRQFPLTAELRALLETQRGGPPAAHGADHPVGLSSQRAPGEGHAARLEDGL